MTSSTEEHNTVNNAGDIVLIVNVDVIHAQVVVA